MKKLILKVIILKILCLPHFLIAGNIKGIIIDKEEKEPMIGVTIRVIGTNIGTTTNMEGEYEINNLPKGTYSLEIRYLSYKPITIKTVKIDQYSQIVLNVEMEAERYELQGAIIEAKRNYETEAALIDSRRLSSLAIENIGAKELSNKGVSTAADGVKKMTGISSFGMGRVIVRGLGDRYSITTLNKMPIASPNPDNKLIPLDLFPVSVIKNITVSKVYNVENFADYSGAHIDISTKENIGEDFLCLSLQTGGNINTLFQDFYQSDKNRLGLWGSKQLDPSIKEMKSKEFSNYTQNNDVFGTSFKINKQMSLPEWGGGLAFGKQWKLPKGKMDLLASLNINSDYQTINNVYIATYTAQGNKLNEFTYDSYTAKLNIASLVNVGYSFKDNDRISYTFLYARNASDNYKYRTGYDSEGNNLIGNNSVMHVYSLINNQIIGKHELGKKWTLFWSTSYGITQSMEPDRRQVMYRQDAETISLFKLNQQETMRYFGELNEKEWVAELRTQYVFGKNNHTLHFGASYKNKDRDFSSVRFYYNLNNINPAIDDVFQPDDYLNQENIAQGVITIKKDAQPKSNYFASNQIGAGFAELDFIPHKNLLVNFGLRYEYVNQHIQYWNDAAIEKRSELIKGDVFPAINIKFDLNKQNNLRLSLSKTVTRPSFIEMSPFLYKESYGTAEIRGNENLQNGYNYNIDLRYEFFPKNKKELLSSSVYVKYLQNPIEQVQESSGGAAVYSFRNAENGFAAGVELEFRKEIVENFRFGCNVSYMYTNVILPENGGIYTDNQRALQGASPYLLNSDIGYRWKWKEDAYVDFILLYNLQGPRIHSVGIYGLGNVMQKTLHSLDFVTTLVGNKHWEWKAKINNLLNHSVVFTQQIKTTAETKVVESYKPGLSFSLSINYKL